MDRMRLRDDLVAHFSAEELALFSARLGISFTNLGGNDVSDKAVSLIGKMDRDGRLLELVYLLLQEEPQLRAEYQTFLEAEAAARNERLEWLDRMAAGEGPAIEEPPTMRWDSTKHPREERDG